MPPFFQLMVPSYSTMCRTRLKVTLKCQSQTISCSPNEYYNSWRILSKLGSMLTWTRLCAELIPMLCQFKVKVLVTWNLNIRQPILCCVHLYPCSMAQIFINEMCRERMQSFSVISILFKIGSTRKCAESMMLLKLLNVNVTL
jgi:hypothetical protein